MQYRRIVRRIGKFVLLLTLLVAIFLGWANRAAHQVPQFYQEARLRLPSDLRAANAQLQKHVTLLQERVKRHGDWEAIFTEMQINAWLASELPQEYPQLLPTGVSDSCVVIDQDIVRVAAKFENRHFSSVISFEIYVRLTDQPNVLAIQIANLRAGALPLPISRFREQISQTAFRGQFEVRWTDEQGNPIALVTVPSDHPRYVTRPVIIEKLGVMPGEIHLGGHSGAQALRSFVPQGLIFKIASHADTVRVQ